MSHEQFTSVFVDFLSELDSLGLHDVHRMTILSETKSALNRLLETAILKATASPQAHDQSGLRTKPSGPDITADGDEERIAQLESLIATKIHQHGDPRDVFIEFDILRDGVLSPEEFELALAELNIFLSDKELQTILKHYDTFGDGKINYHEFLEALSRPKSISEYDESFSNFAFTHSQPKELVQVHKPHEMEIHDLATSIQTHILRRYGKIQRAFLAMSHSSASILTFDELCTGISNLGFSITQTTVKEMLQPYVGTRKRLTLNDFHSFMNAQPRAAQAAALSPLQKALAVKQDSAEAQELIKAVEMFTHRSSELLPVFVRYDMDRDGLLTAEELRRAFAVKGYRIPLTACKSIIQALSSSRSHKLHYDTFLSLIGGQPAPTTRTTSATVSQAAKAAERRRLRQLEQETNLGVDERTQTNDVGSSSQPHRQQETVQESKHRSTDTSSQLNDRWTRTSVQPQINAGNQRVGADLRSQTDGGRASDEPMLAPRIPPRQAWTTDAQASAPIFPGNKLLRRVNEAIYGSSQSVRDVWKHICAHGQNGADAYDLRHGLRRLGLHITHADATSLINAFDADHDDALNLSEFVHMLSAAHEE